MSNPFPFVPANFFALRTPLLPFATFLQWSTDLSAIRTDEQPTALARALAADRATLRQRLADLLAQPAIREAIFVASPDLHAGLGRWRENPNSEKSLGAERALVRYFARMAGRATPFGLFSGCSVGTIGEKTALALVGRAAYQRHTRLDMDYLFALCEAWGRDPARQAQLRYYPNSSLYRVGGRLRYAEAQLTGKVRDYHLVVLEENDYLTLTLAQAQQGATVAELAAAIIAADPEISHAEATTYLAELIANQILVSKLIPAVTGREPIHALIEQLAPLQFDQGAEVQALCTVRDALAALDADGLGSEPARYQWVAAQLQSLPTPVELARLFQVDMLKPAPTATLGKAVLNEITQGIQLLHRLAPVGQDPLADFRSKFVARYGQRAVPLMEALDEESGIGFRTQAQPDHAPLLAGLDFPTAPSTATVVWDARQQWLLQQVEAAWRSGVQTIELNAQELATLTNKNARPLPASFAVMATLAASSQAALDQGDFRIYLEHASGPSGARLLGRFCHGDPQLHQHVVDYLAAEASHDSEAIFAEIVHLPEGRIGNILCRPVLRAYEIPYLGQSGAATENQIPVSDLWVAVVNGQVILRSQRLQRPVIPRLTSAHYVALRGQGVYMFLGALQAQGVTPTIKWDWGALTSADFLPRITVGRLVLARARWRMRKEEIQHLAKQKDSALFRAVQAWREQRQLPRFIVLTDGDNELPVDLTNILSIESFVDTIKGRSEAQLHELFPGPDELCAVGPEGAFVHELVIPFSQVRQGPEPGKEDDQGTRKVGDSEIREQRLDNPQFAIRTFPPGSAWLYAKLYSGSATADQILTEVVAPVARQVIETGAAERWFFIRYGDPDWHLRLRFEGDPVRLQQEVLPLLHRATAPHLAEGRIWRLQLDTYEREVERYGGPMGIALAEQLFHADSEAVLSIVEQLDGDAGADARWRLTLAGMDLLLDDLGFTLATKQQVVRRARDGFRREFQANSQLRGQLGERYRRERQDLAWLLDSARNSEHPLAPGLAFLRQRSLAWQPSIAQLQRLAQAGYLTLSLPEMAASYLHMQANRLLRSAQRAQELVFYDFLDRHYEMLLARTRTQWAAPSAVLA